MRGPERAARARKRSFGESARSDPAKLEEDGEAARVRGACAERRTLRGARRAHCSAAIPAEGDNDDDETRRGPRRAMLKRPRRSAASHAEDDHDESPEAQDEDDDDDAAEVQEEPRTTPQSSKFGKRWCFRRLSSPNLFRRSKTDGTGSGLPGLGPLGPTLSVDLGCVLRHSANPWALLGLCMSSLHMVHARLLCAVPMTNQMIPVSHPTRFLGLLISIFVWASRGKRVGEVRVWVRPCGPRGL